MEKDKIETLLQKYWQAETTVEEENLIKAYLLAQGADQDHREDKNWFASIREFHNIEHREVHFTTDQQKTIRIGLPLWLKIAAITVLVSGLSWLGVEYNHKVRADNEVLARRTAEASLMSMSHALNQAYQHLNAPTGLTNKENSKK